MKNINDVSTLKKLFKQTKPDKSVQSILSPSFRNEEIKNLHQESLLDAAVGIILFYVQNNLSVLFIERAVDNGPHSGQMAFPGGARETSDHSLIETAYREIYEEIGVEKKCLSLISDASTLYVPVSGFIVHPYVFFASTMPFTFLPNKAEVKKIYIFSVKDFYNPQVLININIEYKNKSYVVPSFNMGKIVIWGATAMMWNECLYILKPLFDEQNTAARSSI